MNYYRYCMCSVALFFVSILAYSQTSVVPLILIPIAILLLRKAKSIPTPHLTGNPRYEGIETMLFIFLISSVCGVAVLAGILFMIAAFYIGFTLLQFINCLLISTFGIILIRTIFQP